nr:hypothetical protein [Clavibacter phaseoli]
MHGALGIGSPGPSVAAASVPSSRAGRVASITRSRSASTRVCSVVTCTDIAMWWMKYTSTATSATASSTAALTASTRTNPTTPSSSVWMERSTMSEYRNVEVSTASTTWLPRSAMKFRTSRGPYEDDVVASTEIVMENEVAATPSIVPPMAERIARPPVADRSSTSGISSIPAARSSRSTSTRPSARTTAPRPSSAGRSQKDSRAWRSRDRMLEG